MRNEETKNTIVKFRNDGYYVSEIADELGISERTVYRYLKEIREENIVMTPKHPDWVLFCGILEIRLASHPCDAETLKQSRFVLKEFFPNVCKDKSVEYFREHGGYCDCEVLMNVDGK